MNYYDFIKLVEMLYFNFEMLINNGINLFDLKNNNNALREHREKQKKYQAFEEYNNKD